MLVESDYEGDVFTQEKCNPQHRIPAKEKKTMKKTPRESPIRTRKYEINFHGFKSPLERRPRRKAKKNIPASDIPTTEKSSSNPKLEDEIFTTANQKNQIILPETVIPAIDTNCSDDESIYSEVDDSDADPDFTPEKNKSKKKHNLSEEDSSSEYESCYEDRTYPSSNANKEVPENAPEPDRDD